MTLHRATCKDCPWTYESDDLLEVSDALDAHAQKEMHACEIERAVATDGGVPTLTFDTQHITPILEGEKTVTYRLDLAYEFAPGDPIRLVDPDGDVFATATVVTHMELRADWIPAANIAGHRHYRTTRALLSELEAYYDVDEINPNRYLDVVAFHVDPQADGAGERIQIGPDSTTTIGGCR